jgi:hypothetical protein
MTEPPKKRPEERRENPRPNRDSDDPSGPETDGTTIIIKQMPPNPAPGPRDSTGPESGGGTDVNRLRRNPKSIQ